MIVDPRDLKVFDPGFVGNIAETVIITDMLFNILPALFDDLVVHNLPPPEIYC